MWLYNHIDFAQAMDQCRFINPFQMPWAKVHMYVKCDLPRSITQLINVTFRHFCVLCVLCGQSSILQPQPVPAHGRRVAPWRGSRDRSNSSYSILGARVTAECG